jgi:hypothetical protein
MNYNYAIDTLEILQTQRIWKCELIERVFVEKGGNKSFLFFGVVHSVKRSMRTKFASCLSTGELGDGLGSFRDSVLGEFTGKHETNGSLDFSAGKSCLLVVGGKLSGFSRNTLKDIVNEGVHDGHSLLGDTSIRVDLLQDLVNVRRVSFDALLLFGTAPCLLGGCCLLDRFL